MIQFPLFARLLEVSMGGEGGSDFSAPIRSLTLVEDNFAARLVKLIKEQLEEGSEEAKQFVYEVKFMLVLMSMLSVLVSQRMEYFVYVSPLYFLFIFFTLE